MGASETPTIQTKTIVKGLVAGSVLVLLGVALPFAFEALIGFILNKMMIIDPSSLVYQEWQNPSLPVYQRFYFFDLQNPDEVLKGGTPEVKEIGPYSYRLFLPKENISFNSNDTVTFLQKYRYVFDPSESVGSEHDVFTSANIPMWSVVYMFRDAPKFLQVILAGIIGSVGEEPFIQLSVRQFVWGYDEPLFKWLNEKFPDLGLPEEFSEEFGFLLGRNDTEFGEYTVFTGVENISSVNLVDKFNGLPELNHWTSDYANQIVGTDGMMYHQDIKEDELLNLFHPDLCRSMPYTYVKDDELKGVPLKMFGIAPWAYQNSSVFPENEGFKVNDRDSVPTGLMRVDPCRFGSPMAVSNPHFFEGDPSLLQQVKGLKPDAEKHRNSFSIEPTLGMPFKLRMRIQVNQYMEKNDIIKQTGDVETMYMPVFWFENGVTATDILISYYDLGINLSGTIATLLHAFCLCIGSTLLVVFLAMGLFRLIERRNSGSSMTKLADDEAGERIEHDNLAYTKSKSDIEEERM
ncbi:scavenger receptor class B member 1-like [Asterias amurensis]|uniref:scavenger receptor class B member 1-like n=1 Tax=Asterias amurensis TaxID=7602 RepID=UPI003AB375A9